MPSPIADTFKDIKYSVLAAGIMVTYGVVLLFLDQFLFFAPYFTVYVPASESLTLILDFALTVLTTLVLTVSIRQIVIQRGGSGPTTTGMMGIITALLAGACPCYYLVPLLAVAGTIGGALGAVGILLNAFQLPIKFVATLMLLFAVYKLEKSGVCKIRTIRPQPSVSPERRSLG
jgi:hypothetical protein